MLTNRLLTLSAATLAALSIAGCDHRYVRRDEFKVAVAEWRGENAQLRADASELKQTLQARFQNYDTQITELGGRVRVNVAAYFDYKQVALRDDDKELLNDFAKVVRERNPGVYVTAEGFTDPVGSPGYNRRLGLKRAEVVRDYLVARGLSPKQVRAVSYGEDVNRQVIRGATGEKGLLNRRVALVIDYAPPA